MITGVTGLQFLLLGALFVLALWYEFGMPLSVTVVLSFSTVALGGAIAYLFNLLFAVPAWYAIGTMATACLVLTAWSEARSSSASY